MAKKKKNIEESIEEIQNYFVRLGVDWTHKIKYIDIIVPQNWDFSYFNNTPETTYSIRNKFENGYCEIAIFTDTNMTNVQHNYDKLVEEALTFINFCTKLETYKNDLYKLFDELDKENEEKKKEIADKVIKKGVSPQELKKQNKSKSNTTKKQTKSEEKTNNTKETSNTKEQKELNIDDTNVKVEENSFENQDDNKGTLAKNISPEQAKNMFK